MKILFATMPFDGHFNPATAVAVHLRERGHDVRWYAGPSYQRKLAGLGIPSFPFQRAQEVNGENVAERYPERARLKGPKLIAFDGEMIFAVPADGHYRDVVDIHTEFGFEAIFCDPAFYAAKPLGETLSVPVYALGIWPMMARSRDVPPPFFGLRPARTPVGRLAHRAVRALLHGTMKPGMRRYNALLEFVGSEPIWVGQWLDLVERCARTCFQSGTPGLDYPRSDLPSNVEYVGPLFPHRRALGAPYAHEYRLRRHPSKVVVVSQGNVDNVDPDKLIVPALEALKGTPYLVVVTTGGRHTAELRARYPGQNVLIEEFVDFNVLFAHADAFVSNGGSGSVLLAAARRADPRRRQH